MHYSNKSHHLSDSFLNKEKLLRSFIKLPSINITPKLLLLNKYLKLKLNRRFKPKTIQFKLK